MNHYVKILRSAFLAGLCISEGCVVNLRVGGVAGAVLFSFGLLAVLHYKLKLYTGTAGFIRVRGDWSMLVAVLLGNIIACGVCACAMTYAQPDIIAPDMAIVGSRLAKGPLACFLLAIGCGFISLAARVNSYLYYLVCPSSSCVVLSILWQMPFISWPSLR